jgi:hypothetical protein
MTDPTPIRPRVERKRGPVIAALIVLGLGIVGIVTLSVLITLAVTGQIG